MPTRSETMKVSATVVASVALVAITVAVLGMYLPSLLWAAVLAIAVWPIYGKLEERRKTSVWRKIVAPMIATTLVALVIATPIAIAALVFGRETQSLLQWAAIARHDGLPTPAILTHIPFVGNYIAEWWTANLASPDAATSLLGRIGPAQLLGWTRSFGVELLRRFLEFLVTLLTLFFLFRDGDSIYRRAVTLGRRIFGLRSTRVLSNILAAIHGTIDGLVLVGLAEGAVIGLGYWIAGVPHALTFAVVTGIIAAIPMGAPIVFCAAALLLLFQNRALAALFLLLFSFVVVIITDHIVRPIVIGSAARVPFVLILIGILGGLASLGLIGLFVGPALMAVLMTLWRDYTDFEEDEENTLV